MKPFSLLLGMGALALLLQGCQSLDRVEQGAQRAGQATGRGVERAVDATGRSKTSRNKHTNTMQKFTLHKGLVAPMDRENVDTDAIIPKQFLKSIRKTGFGPNLFDEWRYLDKGEPGPGPGQPPAQPRLRAQPAALSGCIGPAGAQELRLRLQPRTRALGHRPVRLSRHHCAQLCRHLFQQLLQERPAADPAARGDGGQLFDEVLPFPGYS
jgi:hypothetical protein